MDDLTVTRVVSIKSPRVEDDNPISIENEEVSLVNRQSFLFSVVTLGWLQRTSLCHPLLMDSPTRLVAFDVHLSAIEEHLSIKLTEESQSGVVVHWSILIEVN